MCVFSHIHAHKYEYVYVNLQICGCAATYMCGFTHIHAFTYWPATKAVELTAMPEILMRFVTERFTFPFPTVDDSSGIINSLLPLK